MLRNTWKLWLSAKLIPSDFSHFTFSLIRRSESNDSQSRLLIAVDLPLKGEVGIMAVFLLEIKDVFIIWLRKAFSCVVTLEVFLPRIS